MNGNLDLNFCGAVALIIEDLRTFLSERKGGMLNLAVPALLDEGGQSKVNELDIDSTIDFNLVIGEHKLPSLHHDVILNHHTFDT